VQGVGEAVFHLLLAGFAAQINRVFAVHLSAEISVRPSGGFTAHLSTADTVYLRSGLAVHPSTDSVFHPTPLSCSMWKKP